MTVQDSEQLRLRGSALQSQHFSLPDDLHRIGNKHVRQAVHGADPPQQTKQQATHH